jgi:hypothetical protein
MINGLMVGGRNLGDCALANRIRRERYPRHHWQQRWRHHECGGGATDKRPAGNPTGRVGASPECRSAASLRHSEGRCLVDLAWFGPSPRRVGYRRTCGTQRTPGCDPGRPLTSFPI